MPSKRLTTRAALALASLLVALLAAELAHRAWRSARGRPYDGAALGAKLRRGLDTMAAFTPAGAALQEEDESTRVLHPYFASELEPDTGGVLAWFRETPPEAAFEVLVVGGSVAASWCHDESEAFARRLERDPRLAGRDVRVLDFAHAAYKQPQQLNRVAYLFSHGYRPDVVINLDGFNEVANALQNGTKGTNPLFPSAPVWASLLWSRGRIDRGQIRRMGELLELREKAERALATVERWRLLHSSLLGTFTAARIEDLYRRRAAIERELRDADPKAAARLRRSPEFAGPPYDQDEGAIVELALTAWLECSRSLHALCAAREIPYLHCLQPTLHDPGSKPLTEEERSHAVIDAWKRGVELGYPRLRALGEQLRSEGVAFLDLSAVFAGVEETLYYDPCHFVEAGCRHLSDAIEPVLLELLAE